MYDILSYLYMIYGHGAFKGDRMPPHRVAASPKGPFQSSEVAHLKGGAIGPRVAWPFTHVYIIYILLYYYILNINHIYKYKYIYMDIYINILYKIYIIYNIYIIY